MDKLVLYVTNETKQAEGRNRDDSKHQLYEVYVETEQEVLEMPEVMKDYTPGEER